jgi:hypothetical protein
MWTAAGVCECLARLVLNVNTTPTSTPTPTPTPTPTRSDDDEEEEELSDEGGEEDGWDISNPDEVEGWVKSKRMVMGACVRDRREKVKTSPHFKVPYEYPTLWSLAWDREGPEKVSVQSQTVQPLPI